MAWRVRSGVTVHHDGAVYVAGKFVPCDDEQAAAMLHAVERFGDEGVKLVPPIPIEMKKRGAK